MTNDECQRTKEIRNPKSERRDSRFDSPGCFAALLPGENLRAFGVILFGRDFVGLISLQQLGQPVLFVGRQAAFRPSQRREGRDIPGLASLVRFVRLWGGLRNLSHVSTTGK